MTVDRLAALEAALRVVLSYAEAQPPNAFERINAVARAALDADSRPAPDQGALERARELYETTAHFYAIDRLWIHNIAGALTAAASEARAAALLDYASKLEALGEIKPSTLTVDDAVRGIIADLLALATPAQSEGK